MRKTYKQIQFNAKLPYTIKKDKNWYISSCPILDVYSQGKTKEEAKKNLKEALSLFFISCFERGTLDKVMKDCGFISGKVESKAPKIKSENLLNIPIPFQWDKSKKIECRV
ncbi:MAG: type II toxin-antitoxin system HicB family antitoxin [bacterium]